MAVALKNTPMYEDQLVAWHNQRLWWLLLASAGLLAGALGVIAVLILRPTPPPYVIEVNAKGEPVGALQPVLGTHSISDQTIRWAIGEYIDHAFRVERDFDEEQMVLGKVYAMSTGQAGEALKAYYWSNKHANDPLLNGSKYWQEVKILRTLALPAPDTYQVDFQTTRHNFNDEGTVTANWRATMQIIVGKPTETNPLGLFVTSLDFSPEVQQ
jgi:type IV secretory pathway TrbF-like protein